MKIKKIPHSSFYLIQDRVHLKWLMLLKPKLGKYIMWWKKIDPGPVLLYFNLQLQHVYIIIE